MEILERLVGFDSISGRPTHDIVGYISDHLTDLGIEATLSFDEAGERANVFATIGPAIDGGIVLNGHMDVVPVDGQKWSTDPFKLTAKGSRLCGRGAVDMKGFLACVLGSLPMFQASSLKRPIHIAFSYDEEIGGFGMPVLLESMAGKPFRPSVVIVGEPTEMKIVTGHKGAFEMRTEITGHDVHACNPAKGVNAVSYAMRLISKIEEISKRLAASTTSNEAFEPPYGTFNVGTIEGGAARNVTAGWCNFDWEFRPMPGDDGAAVIAEIQTFVDQELIPEMKAVNDGADIKMIATACVPALGDENAAEAIAFLSNATGRNSLGVVSFGTDAGYFSDAGFSTVVFGPGSITRAHKPDEYIEVDELAEGLGFLQKVAQHCSH